MKIQIVEKPVYHIIIDDCFGKEISSKILEEFKIYEPLFQDATIYGSNGTENNPKIRKNKVLYIDTLFNMPNTEWQLRKLHRAGKSILLKTIDDFIESKFLRGFMESAPFPLCKLSEVNSWETQVSRYGEDESHYDWHIDRISGMDNRVVSVVYYVNSEPKQYQGGDLLLTNKLKDGETVNEEDICRITPQNDRLVIFNSRSRHAVDKTTSSEKFLEGRFSINIWCGFAQGSFY